MLPPEAPCHDGVPEGLDHNGLMDLYETPAVDLARMLRSRQLSARELLTAFLDRIDRINPEINAIVTLAAEEALAAAGAADDAAAGGGELGPLHGLPIAIKDLAETAGLRTTFGSPVFAANVPQRDSAYVVNLRRAGAIVLGTTNTPEFGAGSQTFNPIFGTTRNPYDRVLTPGGSGGGGGRAAAVRGWLRSGRQRPQPGGLLQSGGTAYDSGPGPRRSLQSAERGGAHRPHSRRRRPAAGRAVRSGPGDAARPSGPARGLSRPAPGGRAWAAGRLDPGPGRPGGGTRGHRRAGPRPTTRSTPFT